MLPLRERLMHLLVQLQLIMQASRFVVTQYFRDVLIHRCSVPPHNHLKVREVKKIFFMNGVYLIQ